MGKSGPHPWVDWGMVQGDTAPSLPATLREADGTLTNLQGVQSVNFIMKGEGQDTPKVNSPMQVVNADKGEVAYNWASGDTDTPGFYLGYVQVVFSSGDVATYPGTRYWELEIRSKL